jgi:hypothetical protein
MKIRLFLKASLALMLIGSMGYTASRITNANIATNAAIAFSKMASLTGDRALMTTQAGVVAVSSDITVAEMKMLDGVSSNLQTQLDGKQTLDGDLTALAALSGTDNIYYRSAANTWTAVTMGAGLSFSGGSLAASGSPALSVVTKTANYTLASSDDLVLVNAAGGSFTLTLPTAVGATGKIYRIKRTDGSLSTTVSIATTSSQTVDAYASSAVKLFTKFEQLEIVSDGANWAVLNHKTETPWTLYTPTYSEFGSVATSSMWWKRRGDSVLIRGRFVAASVAASEARMSLPAGLTSDSTKISSRQSVGKYIRDFGSGTDTAHGGAMLMESGATYLTFGSAGTFGAGNNNPLNNANSNAVLTGANDFLSLEAEVPISGWNE